MSTFMHLATPFAARLASLAALSPSTSIEVLRAIQEELVPESAISDLAEVVVSGLFESAHREGDDVRLQMRPGCRNVLLEAIGPLDHWDVYDAVSRSIARRYSSFSSSAFRAAVLDSEGSIQLPAGLEPFAELARHAESGLPGVRVASRQALKRGVAAAQDATEPPALGPDDQTMSGLTSATIEMADQGDLREHAVSMGKVADILEQRGETDGALRIRLEEQLPAYERLGDVRSRAVTLGDIARIRSAMGDLDGAMRVHAERLAIFDDLGDRSGRAVTLGDIAHIRSAVGDLDLAIRLHAQRLAIFDDLGDRSGRAVTLGDIAHIRSAKGDMDDAMRLHEERLAIFDALGDKRERAVTLGDIARIRSEKGDMGGAMRMHEERLAIFDALGDKRERAVTLGDIAHIRLATADLVGAMRMHEERLAIFDALGDKRERAVTLGDIARIRSASGDMDDAMRLHEERLAIFDELADQRERAVTLGDIADLLERRGETGEALRIRREEELPVYEHLGDVRSRIVTMHKIADVLLQRGETDEALRIRRELLLTPAPSPAERLFAANQPPSAARQALDAAQPRPAAALQPPSTAPHPPRRKSRHLVGENGSWIECDLDQRERNLILFVHGYTGSAVDTWQSFPHLLLRHDQGFHDGYDIGAFGYDTNLVFNRADLATLSEQLRSFLEAHAAGVENVFLVTHSLGGIVARAYMVDICQTPRHSALYAQLRQVHFVASPQEGAPLPGRLARLLKPINPLAWDLRRDSPLLAERIEAWLAFAEKARAAGWPLPALFHYLGGEDRVASYKRFASGRLVDAEDFNVVDGNYTALAKPVTAESTVFKLVTARIRAQGGASDGAA
ncbi:MAG: tetratricopeptide repeat protein [Ardenticatenales bacterium]|nr:tetratricopeptide repeat protein [Ardenticatenales bacterium]